MKRFQPRLRFQGKVIAVMMAAICVVQVATLAAVQVVTERSVRDQLGEQLQVAGRVWQHFHEGRDTQLLESVAVLADDFGFKAAVASNDLATMRSALANQGSRLGADLGVLLAEDGELTPPPPRPERRIEFFGDSITSGMGNEAPEDGADDNKAEKNNFLAYGAITARNLGAEYVSTSQSGVGLMASFVGFTMQDFYDQLSAIDNNNSKWDFNRWTPHVVVINLFQNDSALVEERLDPVPTDEQRIAVYYDFVRRIRGHYPEAYIICTLGTMDASKPGSPWPGYIHSAVEQWKAETNDQGIDVMIFEFKDFYKHPRVHHHRENAEVLTAFIKEKMGW